MLGLEKENETMIPKKIHYCWFGAAEPSTLIKRCMESWGKYATDFELELWNEKNSPIEAHEYMRIAYHQKRWAFVSDYMRLLALYEQGGVYLDTDMELVKPLDRILHSPLFMGYESENQMNGAIIGATSRNQFIHDCLVWMDNDAASGRPTFISIPKIMQHVWDAGKYEAVIYAPEYFYPYNPYDKAQQVKQLMFSDITENTFAIHHWNASWVGPKTWTEYLIGVLRHAKKSIPG